MKHILISALLLAIPLQVYATTDKKLSKKEIIKNVEAGFAKVSSLKGNFKQIVFDASMGDTEISTGFMQMKKPLKMVWQYKKPTKQTLISDGREIYLFIPAEKQVMVEPMGNLANSRSPLLFLAGKKKLSELFYIKILPDGKKSKSKKRLKLSLKPREKSLSITRLVIQVDRRDWLIRSFSIYDWVGNRTDISFSSLEVNAKVEDTVFKFKKPRGVEEISLPPLNFGVE